MEIWTVRWKLCGKVVPALTQYSEIAVTQVTRGHSASNKGHLPLHFIFKQSLRLPGSACMFPGLCCHEYRQDRNAFISIYLNMAVKRIHLPVAHHLSLHAMKLSKFDAVSAAILM